MEISRFLATTARGRTARQAHCVNAMRFRFEPSGIQAATDRVGRFRTTDSYASACPAGFTGMGPKNILTSFLRPINRASSAITQ